MCAYQGGQKMPLKYTEYYVITHVRELHRAAIVLMEIERSNQMTHVGRNNIRYCLRLLLDEIARTCEETTSEGIAEIPF